jgi:hypothetical protein
VFVEKQAMCDVFQCAECGTQDLELFSVSYERVHRVVRSGERLVPHQRGQILCQQAAVQTQQQEGTCARWSLLSKTASTCEYDIRRWLCTLRQTDCHLAKVLPQWCASEEERPVLRVVGVCGCGCGVGVGVGVYACVWQTNKGRATKESKHTTEEQSVVNEGSSLSVLSSVLRTRKPCRNILSRSDTNLQHSNRRTHAFACQHNREAGRDTQIHKRTERARR